MEIKLDKPVLINDNQIEKIDLKLDQLTGADILQIDLELRAEGNPDGMNTIHNQNVLIKIASKASGILVEDLKKLSISDFIDVTFSVRNFLLGYSGKTEEPKTSDESSSSSAE